MFTLLKNIENLLSSHINFIWAQKCVHVENWKWILVIYTCLNWPFVTKVYLLFLYFLKVQTLSLMLQKKVLQNLLYQRKYRSLKKALFWEQPESNYTHGKWKFQYSIATYWACRLTDQWQITALPWPYSIWPFWRSVTR